MSEAVSIERASMRDVALLVEMVREYWAFESIGGFDAGRAAKALAMLLSSPHYGAAWIARVGDRAAGYLVACYVFSLERSGITAELDEFFVRPDFRGASLGRRLLESAETEFRLAGCSGVFMEVGRDNDAARRFYERQGYRVREAFGLMAKPL